MSRFFRLACGLVVCLCIAPAIAWAVAYTITTLDAPIAPIGNTTVEGINNQGQVVGEAHLDFGEIRGFAYDSGVYAQIFAGGGLAQLVGDINSAGQIVGQVGEGAFLLNVPFAHLPFVMPSLMPTPDLIFPIPTQTALAKLSPDLGVVSSDALRINNTGLVYGIGDFSDPSGTHNGRQHFVYDSVSDSVEFVPSQPLEFELLPYSPFTIPGAHRITVRDVTDTGLIAGTYVDDLGQHGFFGTPIPEPSTLALASLPLLLLWKKYQQ